MTTGRVSSEHALEDGPRVKVRAWVHHVQPAGFQLRGMNPDLGGWTAIPGTDFVGLAAYSLGVAGESVKTPVSRGQL